MNLAFSGILWGERESLAVIQFATFQEVIISIISNKITANVRGKCFGFVYKQEKLK